MNAYVDQTGCISCGLCVSMCPQVFVFNEEGKAESFVDPIPAGAEESAQSAVVTYTLSEDKSTLTLTDVQGQKSVLKKVQ